MLNITYKDRKTNIWVRERTTVENNEMVMGRAYLEDDHNIMTRKDDKGDQTSGGVPTWTNTGATRSGRGHYETLPNIYPNRNTYFKRGNKHMLFI